MPKAYALFLVYVTLTLKGPTEKSRRDRAGREIPLIGVADVSLRGLGSPEEGEQRLFGPPPYPRPEGSKNGVSRLRNLHYFVLVQTEFLPSAGTPIYPRKVRFPSDFSLIVAL